MRTCDKQPGWAVWLTGVPASGKSSIARELLRRLRTVGVEAERLESDAVRRRLTPAATYADAERDMFYAALVWGGTLLTRHGVNVIFDATAHRRAYREAARRDICRFVEVWVRCEEHVCRARDHKGIYSAGGDRVPGLDVPYEGNAQAELVIDSEVETPARSAERIIAELRRRGWLPHDAMQSGRVTQVQDIHGVGGPER